MDIDSLCALLETSTPGGISNHLNGIKSVTIRKWLTEGYFPTPANLDQMMDLVDDCTRSESLARIGSAIAKRYASEAVKRTGGLDRRRSNQPRQNGPDRRRKMLTTLEVT